ncbi:serine hydrolase domain-containing protein [Rugamonas sp. CCM 8940]|uniref:serine hydrolase domain-containing protein n=1 Tax=Rugamonas sp. CCM 8940 TaxID=2765359 RepID=UPI0018F4E273|nr:serine hydrolase domain-containing protein [Rugamonas sp. CCM 8940]MBJ7310727.1 beta-lactamase family protein [Rugamonas sp. CCM 8940]
MSGVFRRLLGLLAVLLASSGSGPARADELTADLARLLGEQGLQGAVWATVAQDGAIATGAAGIKDARHGNALSAGDRVQVGSVAKTLLAVGILRLVSQGRLGLDTPVAALLPGVVFDNRWQASDPVRVRHLLDHTAGLDDARFAQVFSLRARADTPLDDALAGGGLLQVRSRPGSRCSYSNTGYVLLGRVVEALTGQRYEAYLDANLLRPLGMLDSTFGFVSQDGPQADTRLAMGHFEHGATQPALASYLRPAGQFTTTAADMGRFARFLMGDGKVDGRPFIAAALLQAMGRPSGSEAARAGLQVGFALGLATRDRHGVVGKCHGGSTIGYRAMLCLFPQQGRAFFISLNTDSEASGHHLFNERLIKALQIAAPVAVVAAGAGGVVKTSASASDLAAPAAAAELAAWQGFYVPAPNRFASLAWFDTVFNVVRLRADGAMLRFMPLQSPTLLLAPVGGGLYRAADRVLPSHVLLRDAEQGRVVSSGTQSYRQVSLLSLLPMWLSLAVGLLGLAYILFSGALRLARRRLGRSHPMLPALAGVLLLALPMPFFYLQSFLRLGELTLASGLLAAVTAALPLTLLAGLGLSVFRPGGRRAGVADVLALLAGLQLTVMLAAWGLLPFRLWA